MNQALDDGSIFAIRSARADFLENEGNLSLVGVATLTEAGLSAEDWEATFNSEGHFNG
jgi:hypothetical protein